MYLNVRPIIAVSQMGSIRPQNVPSAHVYIQYTQYTVHSMGGHMLIHEDKSAISAQKPTAKCKMQNLSEVFSWGFSGLTRIILRASVSEVCPPHTEARGKNGKFSAKSFTGKKRSRRSLRKCDGCIVFTGL